MKGAREKGTISPHLPVLYMDVSKNRGTPKSSILIGFSIINHPFWGTTIFGNTQEPGGRSLPDILATVSLLVPNI